jgi:hypothetical protein
MIFNAKTNIKEAIKFIAVIATKEYPFVVIEQKKRKMLLLTQKDI